MADEYRSPFLALTDEDRDAMLETIGVGSVEELFRDIPEAVRLGRELELEPPLSEADDLMDAAAYSSFASEQ